MRDKMTHIALMALSLFALPGLTACHGNTKSTEQKPVKVRVQASAEESGRSSRDYSGTVESDRSSDVSFSVAGTISRIYVKEGDKVKRGQILASVKGESLSNANNIAQAALDEARDAYNRLKKLHDANALPEIKWVEVQSKLKQAQNAAAIASREMGDASLYAPADGVVSRKLADVGQNVGPAIPVFTIVSVNDVKVSIPVSENDITLINIGDSAIVSFQALDGLAVTGKVVQKDVEADPLTRTYAVKLSIPNTDSRVLPGMTCDVTLSSGAKGTVGRVVPSQAVLLSADNRNFVWLVKSGKAVKRYVTVGDLTGDKVSVAAGLGADDTVIVAGMQKVSGGTVVDAELDNK